MSVRVQMFTLVVDDYDRGIAFYRDAIGMDVALEWNDSYYENVLASPTTSPSATAARISRRSAPR